MSDYVPRNVPIPENDHSLDLCLSLDYAASNKIPQDADEVAPEVEKKEEEPKDIFSCMHCQKKFRNPQSLGGHQNAHRIQRKQMKEKKLQRLAVDGSASRTPVYPYATSQPSIFGHLHRPLGVERSVSIQKHYPMNRLRFGYGGQAMPYMLSPQQYPPTPFVAQSWPANVGFQILDPTRFRAWTPIGFTSQGSSSQTLLYSDVGASGSTVDSDATKGVFGHGRSYNY